MPKRLYVTESFPGESLSSVPEDISIDLWKGPEPITYQELAENLKTADGLLCMLTNRVDRALLEKSRSLSVVSSMSVGLDHVDVAACTEFGVPVGNTPNVLTQTTAELTFALMLAASRRVVESDRFVRGGLWKRWDPELLLGVDLHGSVLGIIGMGRIGQTVTKLALAFGMEVMAWSRTRREIEGVVWVPLEILLARSDFVSIHVSLNDSTRNLLDRDRIMHLKDGAFLINTSRGGIVDERALCERLTGGELGGAGLDVFEVEPLSAKSPLLNLENVVVAPHIGSASQRTRVRMGEMAVANAVAGLLGKKLPNCANREVYD